MACELPALVTTLTRVMPDLIGGTVASTVVSFTYLNETLVLSAMPPKETPTKHSFVPKFSPLIVILSPGFMGSGSIFVILGRARMTQTGAMSTESPGPPTDVTSYAPEPIPGMVTSAEAAGLYPKVKPNAMANMTRTGENFVSMEDTPTKLFQMCGVAAMLSDDLRVVNMTAVCDRSVYVRCGVAAFAPARRQLAQDLLGLLHPLLGLDVRSPGLPGRAFDGCRHRRDLLDRLLLAAIGAFRIGRIEIQRLLFLKIPPASFAVVLVERHGASSLRWEVLTDRHYTWDRIAKSRPST